MSEQSWILSVEFWPTGWCNWKQQCLFYSKQFQVTMPKRGKPEPPILNYGGTGGLLPGESGILEWDSSQTYHLSWQLPEDNGLPIDMFLLRYFPVRHEVTEEGNWRRTGAVVTEEISGVTTRHPILFPYTNTYVQIILQAHNEFGFSQEAMLVIRVVKGTELNIIQV